MRFTPIEPHESLDLLAWRSESGRWEIGFRSVIYGIRVSLSLPRNRVYVLDYCCGTDGNSLIWVFHMLRNSLLDFEDTVTSGEIERSFPRQNRKPIENDSDCFSELMRLGSVATQRHSDRVEPIDPPELIRQLSQRFEKNRLKLIESLSSSNPR